MRSIEEVQSRWRETQTHGANLANLQRAVKQNSSSSPCISGCRSVCWKTFLLSGQAESWQRALYDGRKLYEDHRDRLLKFIKHPEALAELTIDPLADDPDSPWNTVRQDELTRAEIQQDVQRLPDEASYHEDRVQSMILDILFVYCKLYPERGGYRQGMHEILAPLVYTIEHDAIDAVGSQSHASLDETMLQVLDAAFIEHDAFILFDRIMSNAQSFYEVKEPAAKPGSLLGAAAMEHSSAIVERSKFIHEVCLHKVDPELATHLTNIEILPQIFLIRWVRLLFSREFPFEQFLVLWDTIFAVDPSLELIDLICVAMLIRIRWQLLEADYSVCLQLLLKYPPPSEAHGPHTFVDDALHLRDHLTASGGASLIMKYTGKMPTTSTPSDGSRPETPNFRGFNAFRQRGSATRSPLPSPSKFIQQQGGVEALLQGAAKGAKGVLERGEKLGINQAVRDAVGEIRRNISEARYPSKSPRQVLSEEGPASGLAALERRNQQLAAMLEETVASLKEISAMNLDKDKTSELIEVAAAKIQFVKIYLEDPSMEVPVLDSPVSEAQQQNSVLSDAAEISHTEPKSPRDEPLVNNQKVDVETLKAAKEDATPEKAAIPLSSDLGTVDSGRDKAAPKPIAALSVPAVRPAAPMPTRSSLAQSSFSWMLEPDESSSSSQAPTATKKPATPQHQKKTSHSASREKNAFLFGEVTSEVEGRNPLGTDEIFGLEPLRKTKAPKE